MNKYRVWVDVTATIPWDIKAESKEAAEAIARKLWESGNREMRREAENNLTSDSWVFGDAELLTEEQED